MQNTRPLDPRILIAFVLLPLLARAEEAAQIGTRAGTGGEPRQLVRDGQGRFLYLDAEGAPVLTLRAEVQDARDFAEGRAAVQEPGSNRWGYVDGEGRLVIPFAHAQVESFSEGLAAVATEQTVVET